jgi:serine/threonine-protein kinase
MPNWIKALHRMWNTAKRRRAMRWFRPGAVVRGRYEIIKSIGEGSYGLAYLCADRRKGGKPCVLKHVQPMRGGAARTEAVFQLETGMLIRLNHPRIPRLIEKFSYRGAFCFTMEYVPGVSLEKLLFEDDAAYGEAEALSLLRRLLDVVSDIHAEGVVHRDIRIANVILDGDRVNLIDFGLARDLASTAPFVPDDVEEDDPMEKKLRRSVHITSDFYAMGHLMLFLLYSTFPDAHTERAWEEELGGLHPLTRKLLRRLLLTEQPYASAAEVIADVEAAIDAFALEETS